ncbi:MAG: N-6 DNA methylase [Flavobacteriaceae bacterium]|jgi:methylase of polypeptide subunit release factors|nr:N-6 DNA methylase [Flavobacteriaceae bacterium]
METIENKNIDFQEVIAKLGFAVEDDCLCLTENEKDLPDPQVRFHIETAKDLNASAVYLRRQLNGSYKPQVYLFDFTDRNFDEVTENELTEIQKKIWTSGEVPLVCVFYNTEIKILDCTKHITDDYKPEYLVKSLKIVGETHKLYNEQFAVKIKSGIFWDEEENKKKFKFQNSAYDKLIDNIKFVKEKLQEKLKNISDEKIITKIIVQSILIKYLEERIDKDKNKLLSEKYFQKYNNSTTFGDVLRKGKFVELLEDLNNEKTGFNGNVFKWEDNEKQQLSNFDLSILADLLATDKNTSLSSEQQEFDFSDLWRYFEFSYIPVELISRLYEEFLGEDKKDKGLYYTPSHLAKLLVDECLPLKKYKKIDLTDFKILDPACGSGIFLVLVFKRLVQIWKLKNDMKSPTIDDLKSLLKNIYGVDKEEQAIHLSAFSLSLALCDELKPLQIINDLKFDDLQENGNLICSNFFTCNKIKNKKFDLVIGNPPFVSKGVDGYIYKWENVEIPQKQLALKFLSESFSYLEEKGLLCLIIKSSSLLYNTSSQKYKETLFNKYNVVQIFDFSALRNNYALWDKNNGEGAHVAASSIFIRKEKPNFKKNILHLTFRRTKATRERIAFEIDDYDLHYVNRQTAINNEFIWKNNLLGGGRVKATIEKLKSIEKLEFLLKQNGKKDVNYGEGTLGGKSLHNNAFLKTKIDDSYLTEEYNASFEGKKAKRFFEIPNFLIKTNLNLPYCINNQYIKFNEEVVGFHSKDTKLLSDILTYFEKNHDILKFYNICTSGQMIVNLGTACKQEDILNLPFDLNVDLSSILSEYDLNIIRDINDVMQLFLRRGECESKKYPNPAIRSLNNKQKDFQNIFKHYGTEFSKVLNLMYKNNNRKFRLSDVVELKKSLIATVFKYDTENTEPKFGKNIEELNIENLTENKISSALSVNRIIKLYPQKDTIVFVKPNQYRYWLSLIAYRDADVCFADFAEAGF